MTDRNFDDLAERFQSKVYGGLKGRIRLEVIWRDLLPVLETLESGSEGSLQVLDAGGGLGQCSLALAHRGHEILFNDLSAAMTAHAREMAMEEGVGSRIRFYCGPYQSLVTEHPGPYDLVLCHALLEWLEHPEQCIATLKPLLKEGGYLSLCFYNPDAVIYRNLVRGNFNWIRNRDEWQPDRGSLTPANPCSRDEVLGWLEDNGLSVVSASGLRVFHDYVVDRRGGNAIDEEVLAMELEFSRKEPFKWLGRYIHIIART